MKWVPALAAVAVVSVTGCASQMAAPAFKQDGLPAALGERWRRNMLLNKWLDYCAERGHRIHATAGVAFARP